MKSYARVANGVVMEVIVTDIDIAEQFHPSIVAECIDVTTVTPVPKQGWVYSAGQFTASAN